MGFLKGVLYTLIGIVGLGVILGVGALASVIGAIASAIGLGAVIVFFIGFAISEWWESRE